MKPLFTNKGGTVAGEDVPRCIAGCIARSNGDNGQEEVYQRKVTTVWFIV